MVVGALTVIQSRINGRLGVVVSDGIFAAWISFGVGLLILLVMWATVPSLRRGMSQLATAVRRDVNGNRSFAAWQLFGGLGGATFVAAQGLTVRFLGVAIFTVAVVASQNGSSLWVDRVGLGPSGVQPVTKLRVIAAVLATIGVGIAVSGRIADGRIVWWALALVFVAGAAIAVQQAVNGRVAVTAGTPWAAGVVNFIVGFAGLTIALGISRLIGATAIHPPPAPWSQPVLWVGGFIGVVFIVVSAAVIKSLGVLLFALLSILGQLAAALVLDLVAPLANDRVDPGLIIGVLVTAVAVSLAAWARMRRVGP